MAALDGRIQSTQDIIWKSPNGKSHNSEMKLLIRVCKNWQMVQNHKILIFEIIRQLLNKKQWKYILYN